MEEKEKQNYNIEKFKEQRRQKYLKLAEEGKLKISDLKYLHEDEREYWKREILRERWRQQSRKYYRIVKEREIAQGIRKRKKKVYSKTFICDFCGKEFSKKVTSKKAKTIMYCSSQCSWRGFNRLRTERYILYCEKLRKKKLGGDSPGINYRVVLTLNGNQLRHYGYFDTKEKAFAKFDKLMEKSNNVVLPRMYRVRNSTKDRYELLLLKADNNGTLDNGRFPNEYGKLIENVVETIDEVKKKNEEKGFPVDWVILNKKKYNIEQEFTIFGYNKNKRDLKNIFFIMDNLLFHNTEPKQVVMYRNKVLIKNDEEVLEVITAYNKRTAKLLYLKLQEICQKNKVNFILFFGNVDGPYTSERTEKMIQKKTGWDIDYIRKIYPTR